MNADDDVLKSGNPSALSPTRPRPSDHLGKFQQPVVESTQKEQSYNKCHFRELWKIENTHFWFSYRNELIAWALSPANAEKQVN